MGIYTSDKLYLTFALLLYIIQQGVCTNITCNSLQNCTVSWDEYFDPSSHQFNNIIYGNDSLSLTVSCVGPNYLCRKLTIHCPTTYHSLCNIICTSYYSCMEIKIFTNSNSILNLTCGDEHACYESIIHIEDIYQANISCIDIRACYSLGIYGDNAKDINIKCLGNYATNNAAACYQPYIYANNASTLNVICNGNFASFALLIWAKNVQHLFVNAVGTYSLYMSSIDARAASNVTINSQSIQNQNTPARVTRLYIPPYNTHLTCIVYGCQLFDLYASNGMGNMKDVTIHSCGNCGSPSLCIQQWNLYCGSAYKTISTITDANCDSNNYCGCSNLTSQIESSFFLGIDKNYGSIIDDKCLDIPVSKLECAENETCTITCTQSKCKNKLIVGKKASSLIVNCENVKSCEAATIFCPESSCEINCNDDSSCHYALVYGGINTTINIQSVGKNGFLHGTIDAENTKALNLHCLRIWSCRFMKVKASKARYINLDCSSTQSCQYLSLFANSSKNVTILVNNGYFGITDAYIHAANASQLQMTCIGASNVYGCYDGHFYLPFDGRTTLNCFGYGCNQLELYVPNGITSSFFNNVLINSCGLCGSIFECISKWTIYCNKHSLFDSYTIFQPQLNWTNSSVCITSGADTLLSTSFINQRLMSQCNGIKIPTPSPTFAPTRKPTYMPTNIPTTNSPTTHPSSIPTLQPTEYPTSNPMTNPTFYPTKNPSLSPTHYANKNDSNITISIDKSIVWIIVVVLIVLCCIIICNVMYCKKYRNKQPIHEKLKDDEMAANTTIAMQHLQQNIQSQTEGKAKTNIVVTDGYVVQNSSSI